MPDLKKRRTDARSLQTLVRPEPADSLSVDYLRTDEAWDDRRRLWQVSRRAVRVTVPLHHLPASANILAPLPLRLTWAATGLAFCASAALLIWTAIGPRQPPPQNAEASVEIGLDPPGAIRPSPVLPAPEEAETESRSSSEVVPEPIAPLAAEPPVAAETTALSPGAPAEAQSSELEPLRIDALESVRQAFAQAVETGVAEPWSENGLSGYVVVGPSMLSEGTVCRNLAIWLDRPGGSGEVMDGRRCLAADGRWLES